MSEEEEEEEEEELRQTNFSWLVSFSLSSGNSLKCRRDEAATFPSSGARQREESGVRASPSSRTFLFAFFSLIGLKTARVHLSDAQPAAGGAGGEQG